ncbi:uncharacterized protein NPIL_666111 [Nephila pilipes]|uniref:Uncharacterized protein n=1 Tax=Nephila pilipes TaxID=299642 RepID=A0A8X6PC74_NEPPI|nr:uncharacterized protein NPIL_666111 [Nephila pilipes]
MEIAKKNRAQQRRLFTKACNAEEASLETSDKLNKLKIIEEKAILMINSEENVKQTRRVSSQQNTLLCYPKIQLLTFIGDIRSWVRFWGQFEKVDKDHYLDSHDKFPYLSQCMKEGSVAEELIKSFPPGGNSYEKAIEQLKFHYGGEELLIQVYVRDLLSLVLQKQNMPKKSLRNLRKMPMNHRENLVEKTGCCFLCLKSGHQAR